MLSSLILCNNNEPFLDQIVMCDEKWILYDNRPAQWLDWEEISKHFPKPNLHHKMVMVTVWWSAAPLIHTAFWILVKPLHLENMVRKSMRCTENCNACSQHWSTEMAQFFSRTTPDGTVTQPMLQRLNELEYEVLPHPPYSPDLLPSNSCFKHIDNFLQGKRFPNQHEAQNSFQEFVNSQSMDFYSTEINKLIFHWQKCVDYDSSYFD